jgi:hypothetical protein
LVSYTPSGKIKDIRYYAWQVFENLGPINLADTITCNSFTDDEDLKHSLLINNSTGAEIATTKLLNVVTVSGASTDTECTLFVYGRRV